MPILRIRVLDPDRVRHTEYPDRLLPAMLRVIVLETDQHMVDAMWCAVANIMRRAQPTLRAHLRPPHLRLLADQLVSLDENLVTALLAAMPAIGSDQFLGGLEALASGAGLAERNDRIRQLAQDALPVVRARSEADRDIGPLW